MSSFVIIGAGECGARAALALRDRGFAGHVTLVGDEELPPYERPPLSKDGIMAGAEPKPVAGTERFAELGIELQLGVAVQSLDCQAKTVVLADGSALRYDKLLLATGSRPRSSPDLPRSDLIRTLRGHADALAIRGLLTGGRRLAILGGGFIGLELAASATKLGASVTVLEARPRILARGVPAAIAERIAERHRAEGVDLVCDARISTVEEKDGTVHLSLDSGRLISADLLVVGIGSLPNTELAAAAGLHVDNGIAVDRHLRTSDPDIFAAGDCCSFPSALYSDRRIRLESWRSAQEQGMCAAANMMGLGEAHASVPWFWSDQHDLTLQVAGLADDGAIQVRRELGNGAFIIFELDETGRLVAASGLGPGNAVARDMRLAEMMIAARCAPDASALAAPEVKLKQLLAA